MADLPKKAFTPKPTRKKTAQRGYGHDWQRIRRIVLGEEPTCCFQFPGICTGWSRHVHHKNHDTSDNRRENLAGCCLPCHLHYHKQRRR